MFNSLPLDAKPVLSIASSNIEGNITFHAGHGELLKITEDGFYVRGERVPADDKEAEAVYRAFKQFLTEHALRKGY